MSQPLVWLKRSTYPHPPGQFANFALCEERQHSSMNGLHVTTLQHSISRHHDTEATNGDANTAASCLAAGLVPIARGAAKQEKWLARHTSVALPIVGTTISRKATTNRHQHTSDCKKLKRRWFERGSFRRKTKKL